LGRYAVQAIGSMRKNYLCKHSTAKGIMQPGAYYIKWLQPPKTFRSRKSAIMPKITQRCADSVYYNKNKEKFLFVAEVEPGKDDNVMKAQNNEQMVALFKESQRAMLV